MAFLGYSLDEDQSFYASGAYLGLQPKVGIPLVDAHAWARAGSFRWVYNKLDIAISQGIPADLIGSAKNPVSFPVIVRPVYNLWGMGHMAQIINSQEELDRLDCAGHFWTNYRSGRHFSWDIAVIDGEPVWVLGFYGNKSSGMRFNYWARLFNQPANTSPESLVAERWIRKHLKGYTGMVNIETIGAIIIECQLRIGDVVVMMADRKFMESVISIYEDQKWEYKEANSPFYLLCLWMKRTQHQENYPEQMLARYRELLTGGAKSWDMEFNDEWIGDPVGHRRVMMIGSPSWRKASRLRKAICAKDPLICY